MQMCHECNGLSVVCCASVRDNLASGSSERKVGEPFPAGGSVGIH